MTTNIATLAAYIRRVISRDEVLDTSHIIGIEM